MTSENGQSMKLFFSGRYQSLPFPVIVTDEKTHIVYKNFAAQKRFPLTRTGVALDRYSGFVAREGVISLEEVYGDRFFVSTSPREYRGEKFLVVSFLESLFADEDRIASLILENSDYLFRELEKTLEELGENNCDSAQHRKVLSHIFARMKAVREYQGIYLRFLRQTDRKENSICSCSVFNLLNKISEKLREAEIQLSVDCPKAACAVINLKDFSFVVLNILQFITLFTGGKKICVKVAEENEKCCLHFDFEDKENFLQAYTALAEDGPDLKNFPHAVAFTPLFCAISVCKKYRVPLRVMRSCAGGEVVFEVKSDFLLPDTYLSSPSVPEEEEIQRQINEIFFLS